MRSGARLLVFASTLSALAIAGVAVAPREGRTLWQFETGG
jgi:hypothetical protein